MSQNTLIEKINTDAAKAVEEIKTQGTAEVTSIVSEIEAEVAELAKAHGVALEKTKVQMELVAVSRAKQAGNIAVQSAKRKQIDAIFNEVTKSLEEQDSVDYVSFFAKYLSEIVPKDAEVKQVHAPAKRKEETEKILKEAGFSGEVKNDPELKAGLVVQTKDGVYDVTLGRLMSERRNELEMVVVNKVMA